MQGGSLCEGPLAGIVHSCGLVRAEAGPAAQWIERLMIWGQEGSSGTAAAAEACNHC